MFLLRLPTISCLADRTAARNVCDPQTGTMATARSSKLNDNKSADPVRVPPMIDRPQGYK